MTTNSQPAPFHALRKRLRAMLTGFALAERGNVATTFALAIVPVIGFVGAAVDYSRANNARTALQSAVDATALMLSKDAIGLNAAQVQAKAQTYFSALYTNADGANVTISAAFSEPQPGSFKIDMTASGTVNTTFTKVIGQNTMPISVTSQAVWGIKKLELALALDNTGSMASNNKMTELKTAASNLINPLQAASKTPGDIKISIIPFDTTVKIGTSFKTSNWIDFNVMNCAHFGLNGGNSGNACSTPARQNAWTGCVMDRDQPHDTTDQVPQGNSSTAFPARQCNGSLATAMPLSYDWNALRAKITSMVPTGNTNVTIGLAWAWHSLTTSTPFTEAQAPASDLDKVIILLTDGDNTQNRWTNNSSQINARTTAACTNVKAANIKLYTVRVINGKASLLSACATNTSMYYNVSNASQLNSVFASIAAQLTNLRLAH
jgi:Flp pilus assembly protein TadG